jgi:hypothetical protein
MEVIWMAPKKFSPEFREQVVHAVIDSKNQPMKRSEIRPSVQ